MTQQLHDVQKFATLRVVNAKTHDKLLGRPRTNYNIVTVKNKKIAINIYIS